MSCLSPTRCAPASALSPGRLRPGAGVHPAGHFTERGYHTHGGAHACAGKGEDPVLCGPPVHHGPLFEHRTSRETVPGAGEGGYPPDTPAAIVYKATWPDEKKVLCQVSDLAETAEREGSKDRLIIVGKVLSGEAYQRSCLYDPAFTTEFRKGNGQAEDGNRTLLVSYTDQGKRRWKRSAACLKIAGARSLDWSGQRRRLPRGVLAPGAGDHFCRCGRHCRPSMCPFYPGQVYRPRCAGPG